jgi:hypothetical protein
MPTEVRYIRDLCNLDAVYRLFGFEFDVLNLWCFQDVVLSARLAQPVALRHFRYLVALLMDGKVTVIAKYNFVWRLRSGFRTYTTHYTVVLFFFSPSSRGCSSLLHGGRFREILEEDLAIGVKGDTLTRSRASLLGRSENTFGAGGVKESGFGGCVRSTFNASVVIGRCIADAG